MDWKKLETLLTKRAVTARRRPKVTCLRELFSTDSGDAWILDPADHLATRIAEEGALRPVHIGETETSFAVGWQGGYAITGAAFVFTSSESGCVMTILGYPTRQIVEQISGIFGDDSNHQ